MSTSRLIRIVQSAIAGAALGAVLLLLALLTGKNLWAQAAVLPGAASGVLYLVAVRSL